MPVTAEFGAKIEDDVAIAARFAKSAERVGSDVNGRVIVRPNRMQRVALALISPSLEFCRSVFQAFARMKHCASFRPSMSRMSDNLSDKSTDILDNVRKRSFGAEIGQ